jgi:hypothetical protein
MILTRFPLKKTEENQLFYPHIHKETTVQFTLDEYLGFHLFV